MSRLRLSICLLIPLLSGCYGPGVFVPQSVQSQAKQSLGLTAETEHATVTITRAAFEDLFLVSRSDPNNTHDFKEQMLIVSISITNKSSSKKIDYVSWRKDYTKIKPALILDEHNNNYFLLPDSATLNMVPVGGISDATLAPGESCQDVLAIEKPIPQATQLTLELPGQRVGSDQPLRFLIDLPNSSQR